MSCRHIATLARQGRAALRRLEHAAQPSCANCGAPIEGTYCANCGQETSLELPTASAFLREAAGRYVALDGRLLRTLAALFFRPGFLTREYLAGRRRRYVRPGRLFLVLSLALFAGLQLMTVPPSVGEPEVSDDDYSKEAAKAGKHGIGVSIGDNIDLKVFDPYPNHDVPIVNALRKRVDAFNAMSPEQKREQLFGRMLRYGPYAMVALLPLFAGLLKLAYVGRRQRYPMRPRRYAAHLVYAAHVHAFAALALLGIVAVPLAPLRATLSLWMVGYLLWSMRAVYGGGWGGVITRWLIVSVVYLVFFAIAVEALIIAAVAVR